MAKQTMGKYIATKRKEKKMTQQQLADALKITNKAVSKWETDAGLPDFSMLQPLSKILGVSIDELINGGDIEETIETIDTVLPKMNKEKKKINLKKYKKVLTIVGIVTVSFLILMQLFYLLFLLPKNYYYIYEGMFYIINIVIVSIMMFLLIPFYKEKRVYIPTIIIATGILATSLSLLVQIEPEIVSFAPNGSAVLVLRENSKTHEMTIYKNQKLWFVQKREQFPYPVGQRIDIQWLASDICAVTYESLIDKKLHQYVATYGVRGNGIRLDDVAIAMEGSWILEDENETGWSIVANTGTIEVTNGLYTKQYETKDIVQFGGIAIVLCDNGLPEWTISLDNNCVIDNSNYITPGGTISLTSVATGKPESKKFMNAHRPNTSPDVTLTAREKGMAIINEMELIFSKTPTLREYESTQMMVKVEDRSMDPIVIAKLINEEDDRQYAVNGINLNVQIESIQVKAGDIFEFLVEIKTKEVATNPVTKESEITNFTKQYRIRKADIDAYLGVRIMHDTDGKVKLNPVKQAPIDTSNDSNYQYFIPGIVQQ